MKKWLKRFCLVFVCLAAITAAISGAAWWYYHPSVERTNGVVYGQRGGQDLTLDLIRPENPNGLAIAVMVSGGWRSQKPGDFPTWMMAPVLRRGYTVFAICHVSQPEAMVQEIIQDMHRGIRFVRHHSQKYGIDPTRIGVTGGSAGGHLSLMLATRGGMGDPQASDPVDRESSEVQAVAVFYPVTDLLNLGESTENLGDGGPPKSFVKSFGPDVSDLQRWKEIGRECSPIYFADDTLPPTLIHHGDADTLVPLDQSMRYVDLVKSLDGTIQLVVHEGGEHGWPTMFLDIHQFAKWFDDHLRP